LQAQNEVDRLEGHRQRAPAVYAQCHQSVVACAAIAVCTMRSCSFVGVTFGLQASKRWHNWSTPTKLVGTLSVRPRSAGGSIGKIKRELRRWRLKHSLVPRCWSSMTHLVAATTRTMKGVRAKAGP
jgi:hypothetical protein